MSTLFFVIIVILSYLLYRQRSKYRKEKKDLLATTTELKHSKKSLEVKYGQLIEKFVPYLDILKNYDTDVHYIGNPIDYVAFGTEDILFLEVKSGKTPIFEGDAPSLNKSLPKEFKEFFN